VFFKTRCSIFAGMFRSVIAYFLILATIVANSSQLFVYAGFELNQKYIVSELCVNRDKPQLHCNGKCYLMRKLKQAEEKEKSRERENQRGFFQQAVITASLSLKTYSFLFVKEYPTEPSFCLSQHIADIFQPPKA